MSPSLDENARLAGAKGFSLAKNVYIPLLRPSIIASICFVLIEVAKELPIMISLRPFEIQTLGSRIWELASDERIFEIAPYALTLMASLTLFIYIINRFLSFQLKRNTASIAINQAD